MTFDEVWTYLPHWSWYQILLCIGSSFIMFTSGIWLIYPVFALYTPNFSCHNNINDLCLERNCSSVPTDILNAFTHQDQCKTKLITIEQLDGVIKCLESSKFVIDYKSMCKNQAQKYFDSLEENQCDSFEYNFNGVGSINDLEMTSLVSDFNLVCERAWIVPFMISIKAVFGFIGCFIGNGF